MAETLNLRNWMRIISWCYFVYWLLSRYILSDSRNVIS
jgi:hypothetical protein